MEENIKPRHFIQRIIDEDNISGKFENRIHTRFPPEPNGYLHIGHAKAICLNFSIANEFGGKCNLRFDDTNPIAEEEEYVQSIQTDVKWLGYDWEDRLYFASDYFQQLYDYAVDLIKNEKAYVCDLTADEIRNTRGNLKEAGKESPYRNRSIDENMALFTQMKNGDFSDGSHTLRAKIDMAHPNMNMRDPVIYRILHAHHHRTGDDWCIYPMYDWAHGLEDSIEGVTHSLCRMSCEPYLSTGLASRVGKFHGLEPTSGTLHCHNRYCKHTFKPIFGIRPCGNTTTLIGQTCDMHNAGLVTYLKRDQ